MRMLLLGVVISSIALNHVHAADFEVHGIDIYMTGAIVPGDYERFEQALRKATTEVKRLRLRSGGGNVLESMKIGRLARSLYLETEAPIYDSHWRQFKQHRWRINCAEEKKTLKRDVPCICASACFFVWSGGAYRSGQAIRLHRISFESDFFGSLSPNEAGRKYQEGLNWVRDYLLEMEIPPRYFDKIVATPSNSYVDLTPEESAAITGSTPAFAEWLIARCRNRPQNEEEYICWRREADIAWREQRQRFLSEQTTSTGAR